MIKDEEYLTRLQVRKQSDQLLVEANQASARGEEEAALALMKQAVKVDPRNYYGFAHLGQLLGKYGRLDEAVACFERAFEIYPKSIHALHSLIPLYVRMGYQDKAADAEKRPRSCRSATSGRIS